MQKSFWETVWMQLFYYLRKPSKAFEAKDVTDHEVESIEQLPVSRIIHNGFTSTRGIIH